MADDKIRDALLTLRRYADVLSLGQLDEIKAFVAETRERRIANVAAAITIEDFIASVPTERAQRQLRDGFRRSGWRIATVADLLALDPGEVAGLPGVGRAMGAAYVALHARGLATEPWVNRIADQSPEICACQEAGEAMVVRGREAARFICGRCGGHHSGPSTSASTAS